MALLQRTNRMRVLFGVGVVVVIASAGLSLFAGRRAATRPEPARHEKLTLASLSAAPMAAPAEAPAGGVAKKSPVAPIGAAVTDTAADEEEDVEATPRGVPQGPPDGLTRGDVVAGLDAVEDPVSRCYGGEGSGSVKLTIASSGRVLGAQVAGPLAGTHAGDCIAAAAREAVFRSNKREATLVWQLPLHVTASSGQ